MTSLLQQLLSSPSTPTQLAIDALEEFILYRRSKGDTLFQLSVTLAELEAKVGRQAIDRYAVYN